MAVGLVEQDDRGVLQQHARERQALAHAGGEARDRVVRAPLEPHPLEQARVVRAAQETRRDPEVLVRGEGLVVEGVVAKQADRAPYLTTSK